MFIDNFISERRSEFLDYVKKFTYTYTFNNDESETVIEGEAVIRSSKISGYYVVWSIELEQPDSTGEYTIQSLELYDSSGENIGSYSTSISVNATQTVLISFKILYQEVTDDESETTDEEAD